MIFRGNKACLRGYTFLEMGLALGVIAILFAAVIPMVSASQAERRLRDSLTQIQDLVRSVRADAERGGHAASLTLQPDGITAGEDFMRLPSKMSLFLRYPRGQWEPAKGQSWTVHSFGAVAPVSVRLVSGDSWVEADFDFLTGSIASERYSF